MRASNRWPALSVSAVLLLTPFCRAEDSKAETARPVVRVAYFIPTDRQPEPDFRARLDRVMTEVQRFYRVGMKQNGYGEKSFELERDSRGEMKVHEVRGRGPMRDYGRNDGDRVRTEVREALLKQKLEINQETVIIFQLLLDWQGNRAIEIGPYVGGGGPRGGTAWVYDDAKLDPLRLASKESGGFYAGPCSIGQFNTHYIGGVAHELGHAFGLPHDCERDADRPHKGHSLMGGGNHTYGQELRDEGPGAFLSPASALPLSVHPLFTGKRMPAAEVRGQFAELQATHRGGDLLLTGRLNEEPRAIGLVARNDSQATPADYDAVGATCAVDPDGTFQLTVEELKPGDYDFRLAVYGESGDHSSLVIHYRVGADRKPDLQPFYEAVWLPAAQDAFRRRSKERLADLDRRLRESFPADAVLRRKVDHLQKLLTPAEPEVLASIPRGTPSVKVADLKFDSERVGWGPPLRNQVLPEGEGSSLVEVGGEFFDSGLYAHAPARHVLRLNGQWKSLATKYGLQDGHDGSVVFVVKGDGKELFRSPTIRDHTAREHMVDVTGVSELELMVEDAGDGPNYDWGVWLDPRMRR